MLRRVFHVIGVSWLAVTLVFLLLRAIPGDAITAQLTRVGVSEAEIATIRAEMGLDADVLTQYARYMSGLLRGDLGVSLTSTLPVTDVIAPRLIPTLTLALSTLVVASVLGISLGLMASLDTRTSRIARGIINLSLSLPIYWTGTLAIIVFVGMLNWSPAFGTGGLKRLILPVAVLSFHVMAPIALATSANLHTLRHSTFARTARAKGLRERLVLWRHVVRPGLAPVLSVIALQAGFLLSGTVITESLFVRSGLGGLLLQSTIDRDFPVVQGIVILAAVFYLLATLLADAFARLLDPRLRA